LSLTVTITTYKQIQFTPVKPASTTTRSQDRQTDTAM